MPFIFRNFTVLGRFASSAALVGGEPRRPGELAGDGCPARAQRSDRVSLPPAPGSELVGQRVEQALMSELATEMLARFDSFTTGR
jgi:hypothetical protein